LNKYPYNLKLFLSKFIKIKQNPLDKSNEEDTIKKNTKCLNPLPYNKNIKPN